MGNFSRFIWKLYRTENRQNNFLASGFLVKTHKHLLSFFCWSDYLGVNRNIRYLLASPARPGLLCIETNVATQKSSHVQVMVGGKSESGFIISDGPMFNLCLCVGLRGNPVWETCPNPCFLPLLLLFRLRFSKKLVLLLFFLPCLTLISRLYKFI